jgi:hypothetical protein
MAKKLRVYVESSVVSYLTSRIGRDPIVAGNKALTKLWWTHALKNYDLVVSQTVLAEVGSGDPDAAKRRLDLLTTIGRVPVTPEAIDLADILLKKGALPKKAFVDALHVAICAMNDIDMLVTWNCTHIANATMQNVIEQTCREAGYTPARICTPIELMEN